MRDRRRLVGDEGEGRAEAYLRRHGGAIEAVDARKRAKLIQLAAQYLAQHRIHDRACRFDVVLIQDDSGTTEPVQHIANAFDVAGDDLRW